MMRRWVLVPALVASCAIAASAADWPTYRHDMQRTGASPQVLPDTLHLQWQRACRPQTRAWPGQDRLAFDAAYEPVVVGNTLFFASATDDSVRALDAETGAGKWRVTLGGPVRFAPLVHAGRLYVVCDDGHLYCMNASDGKHLWKFRGAPTDRMLLGNERLISAWPARGAPALADGKVYFAAGIWPFMGTFIYALDAETGAVAWSNEETGSTWMPLPHGSPAFSGVGPQGYLAVAGDRLLVPGGRTLPACFDRATGKLLFYRIVPYDWVGGFDISVGDRFYGCTYMVFDPRTGFGSPIRNIYGRYVPAPIFEGDVTYSTAFYKDEIRAHRFELVKADEGTAVLPKWTLLWRQRSGCEKHIKVGANIYAGGPGVVKAYRPPDLKTERKPRAKLVWETKIDGTVGTMIAADDRLFVSTLEGRLYCFGAEEVAPKTWPIDAADVPVRDPSTQRAADVLRASGVTEGYALAFGLKDGRLIEEIARGSKLRIVGIEPDAAKVDAIRKRLLDTGLYGSRVAVVHADAATLTLPPYAASLIVSENAAPGVPVEKVFGALRPYGGVALFETPLKKTDLPNAEFTRKGRFTALRRAGALPGSASWTHQRADVGNTLVSRDDLVKAPLGLLWFGGTTNEGILPRHGHGPTEHVVGGRLFIEGGDKLRATDVYTGRLLWEKDLPGFGEAYTYTDHQPGANKTGGNYASAADAVYAAYRNRILKLDPATGETAATFTLPIRKGQKTAPTVGYIGVYEDLLIAGSSAIVFDWDADFTAWQLRGLEKADFDALTAHIRSWTEYPVVKRADVKDDVAFVVNNLNRMLGERTLAAKIPAAHRKTAEANRRHAPALKLARERLDAYLKTKPDAPSDDKRLRELNRLVLRGYYPEFIPWGRRGGLGDYNWDRTSSRGIVIMNRNTGAVLWSTDADQAYRHNAVAVGEGRLFCVDKLPDRILEIYRKWDRPPKSNPRILAFDVRTGKPLWQREKNVFGTWLAYSPEHDVLVEAGRRSPDMLHDEPEGRIIVHRAADGSVVWDRRISYMGPIMIHGERIIMQSNKWGPFTGAHALMTGETITYKHPLTGADEVWRYHLKYGCGTAVASRHLVLFRSSAAGYYDLEVNGGTGTFGGFKSGCTSNLVAADGVLSAPDYTRTCKCSYANQTSLALVHMPEVETWTFDHLPRGEGRLRRVGINLGAPGDRRAPDGTLWLDYPDAGAPSPQVPVALVPEKPKCVRKHSLRVQTGERKWVAASQCRGLQSLTVTLAPDAKDVKTYTVRLHFCELDDVKPGERRFDVAVQGNTVLRNLDIVAVAGGRNRALVREFKDVKVKDTLTVTLTPAAGAAMPVPILSGVEAVMTGDD